MKFPGGDLFIVLFFSIGLTLSSISYYFYHKGQELVANGVQAKGIVIGMHRMKRRQYSQAPSVRFFTPDGKEHVWHSSEGRNPPAYQVGQEVTLYYNPSNLDEVQLENDNLLVYVFGGMGLVFLLFSVWEIAGSTRALWKWIFRSH